MAKKTKSQKQVRIMTTNEIKKIIRYAVIEHYRTWYWWPVGNTERDIFNLLQKAPSGYDAGSVRRVAKKFSVLRGVKAGNNNATAVAKAVNGTVGLPGWGGASLTKRAGICMEAAYRINASGHTNGVQFSLVTKLVWFICQKKWTMYDSYAAKGLRSGATGNKLRFYQKLEINGFDTLAKNIDVCLQNTGLSALYGERVIDKFLWLLSIALDCKNKCGCNDIENIIIFREIGEFVSSNNLAADTQELKDVAISPKGLCDVSKKIANDEDVVEGFEKLLGYNKDQ